MKDKKVWMTNPAYYTIVHRRKGSRRQYRIGYRSWDLALVRDLAKSEAESDEYAFVKIINAETEETIEVLKGRMR